MTQYHAAILLHALVLFAALWSHHRETMAAAGLLVLNFAAWSLAIILSDDMFPWEWAMLIDAMSVVACMYIGHRFLMASFLVLIAMHLAAGMGALSYQGHYLATSVIGFAQVAWIGGIALCWMPSRRFRTLM